MASTVSLGNVTTMQFQQLTRVLWSWSICSECSTGKLCQTEECPWSRSKFLGRFFEFYKNLVVVYEQDVRVNHQASLTSHEDLMIIIEELKSNPAITRNELLAKLFSDQIHRTNSNCQWQQSNRHLAALHTLLL